MGLEINNPISAVEWKAEIREEKTEKKADYLPDLPTTAEGFSTKAQEILANPETRQNVELLANAENLFQSGKMGENLWWIYERSKQDALKLAIDEYNRVMA